jgi:hypothetical protein
MRNRVRRRQQNFCFCLLRVTFVLAFSYQNASAKAEFVYSRKNIGGAEAPTVFALRGAKGY